MKKVYRKKLGAAAKAAKAKIAKKSGGDQFKNLKDWVAFYNANERLPSTKILCACCKKKATSMFGDNLKRTLPRFGSIEALLSKFECSDCRKAKAPVKEKKVKVPRGNKSKHGNSAADSNIAEGNSPVGYMSVDDIEDRKEKVRKTLPRFNPDSKPSKIDFNDPDQVAELTRGACQRPDIYLDAGCPECPMYKLCACASKSDKRRDRSDRRRK